MMTSAELYRNVLRELDKYESPTFDVQDFNYFFNSAIEEYISINYSKFDMKQKELDDIRTLVKREQVTVTNSSIVLPEDYRHLLEISLNLTFTNPRCNEVISYVQTAKKIEADKLGYIRENSYLAPNRYNSYYTIRGNNVILSIGNNITVTSAVLEYLRIPTAVVFDPVVSANNVNSEFPLHVDYELIKLCRRIFLENTESSRYQSQLVEQQQRIE